MATIDENVESILNNTNTIVTQLNTIIGNVDGLEAGVATVAGETPDIRANINSIRVERIYVGDIDSKRAIAEQTLAQILNDGYRPYMTMGISEDYARVAFVKYTGSNAPATPYLFIGRSNKVAAANGPSDFPYRAGYVKNQNKAAVKVDGNIINVFIDGGVDSLDKWESTDPGQTGEAAWIALDIDTGTKDITTVKYGNSYLTAEDVADATAWGLPAGHFILWIRADVVATTPKTFTLKSSGYTDTQVTINVA